ncbi:MAG: hypothetical protein ACOY3V_00165 [Pseudomonadota bacterium]
MMTLILVVSCLLIVGFIFLRIDVYRHVAAQRAAEQLIKDAEKRSASDANNLSDHPDDKPC